MSVKNRDGENKLGVAIILHKRFWGLIFFYINDSHRGVGLLFYRGMSF